MFNHLRQNETLIILCVEVILVSMGIGIISPILPQYARDFGVSVTMVGLLLTSFGIARIIIDIPAGRWAESLGRRPLVITGAMIMALGSIGCGLSGNYWWLLAFRCFQGIGSAIYTTSSMIMLADISEPANRGQTMSLFQGSLLIGVALGPVLGGFAAQYFGLHAPFYILAVLTIIASAVAYFRLPETRPGKLSQITSPSSGNSLYTSTPAAERGIRVLLRNLNFLLISLVTFNIFFLRNGTQHQILPLLAAERLSLSEGQIGIALTVIAIGQFVFTFPAGKLSDHFGRKNVITPAGILIAGALVMLAYSYSYWFLLLSCLLMGIGIGICGPVPPAYVADVISRENYSSGMSLYRAISDLGLLSGPILLGWLADMQGFSFSLLINASLMFLSMLLFQTLAKERAR